MMEDNICLDNDIIRQFDGAGRLIIPAPWTEGSRRKLSSDDILRPVIDVVLKQVDLTVGGEEYQLVPNGPVGHPATRWVYLSPVPIDVEWLHKSAILPVALVVEVDSQKGCGYISNGWNVIDSDWNATSRQWVRAGWRMGQLYAGPIPPPRVHWWQR